jgi:hypothetical protein
LIWQAVVTLDNKMVCGHRSRATREHSLTATAVTAQQAFSTT